MWKRSVVLLVCLTAARSTVAVAEPLRGNATDPTIRRPSLAPGWLATAVAREAERLTLSARFGDLAAPPVQQTAQRRRSWIGRHPVLFGTLAGFGSGFLIGYLPGDDGVFDDFVASFNGLVLGGAGAGTGALVGAIVGAAKK